ncbi:hypothetical protein [Pseudomonas nicosulfuronedens]
MLNPYCPPDSEQKNPEEPTGERSLGKAFWLMFIPAAVVGNVLSVLGLVVLKAIAIELSVPATTGVRVLSWLALSVPYLGTALLGFYAVLRSARPKRLIWIRPATLIVAGTYVLWTMYIVAKAFSVAKLL